MELVPAPRCKGCDGACLWYRLPKSEQLTFATKTPFAVGSPVTVTLPDRYLLLGAVFVYGVPLTMLLAGGALGGLALGSDLAAATGAMLGLAAALFLTPGLRRRLEQATLRHLAVRPVS